MNLILYSRPCLRSVFRISANVWDHGDYNNEFSSGPMNSLIVSSLVFFCLVYANSFKLCCLQL